jgi:D-arabinose 1-dehydrogenase-like Zn-dependent alcohol dehydrogenase
MIARAEALAIVPPELLPEEAAPLMCAGVTTFNCLRHSDARAGDLVAIHGLGGLGHLAVQFATMMGFKTVAIARGKDKAALATELGALHYIDSRRMTPRRSSSS